MQVRLTGRHVEITPALEEFTREHLEKLQKILPAIIEAHAILQVEKYRHRAEINIHTRRFMLSGAHETDDMYQSLTNVFEKLEQQARKRKEKLTSRKRRTSASRSARSSQTASEYGSAKTEHRAHTPRVVHTELPDLKPMSLEDAILQMEESENDFLVFRNARSKRVSVVYLRDDGDFGVIES